MRIIRNKWLPFGKFSAINLFGIVFAKENLNEAERNHEYIHTLQQRELLFVGFYVLYFLEWLISLAEHRNLMKAYYAISFEREAYAHQSDMDYKKYRRPYSWRLFLRS
jgi:hypothetical protein